jgi:phage-related protein
MLQLHIKDKQGNEYTNEDFKFIISEKTIPDMPTQTLVQDKVPGSLKKVTYRREYENRIIPVKIFFYVSSFEELSENINKLNSVLADEVTLRFEEMGYVYDCNLINPIEQNPALPHDFLYNKYYQLEFETTTPYKYSPQASNEALEFGKGWHVGMNAEFSDPTIFNITGDTTIQLNNFGNQPAFPVLKLTGTCDNISIGSLVYSASILNNLTIDCENNHNLCYEVNDGVLTNKLVNLSGSFIEVPPGISDLAITGTNLNLTLEVIYRHTYK